MSCRGIIYNNKSWGYPCALDVPQTRLQVFVSSPPSCCVLVAVVQQHPAAGCVYTSSRWVSALRGCAVEVQAALSVLSGREGVKHGTHLRSAADPATHRTQEPVWMPPCQSVFIIGCEQRIRTNPVRTNGTSLWIPFSWNARRGSNKPEHSFG